MYQYCADHDIPHRNTQKLIVATNSAQDEILQKLQKTAAQNGVILDLISGAQAMALEPEMYATSALVSATTGIVDVHGLLFSLLAEAEELGAVLSTQTCVSQILRTPQGLRVTGDSMGAAFDMSVDMRVWARRNWPRPIGQMRQSRPHCLRKAIIFQSLDHCHFKG